MNIFNYVLSIYYLNTLYKYHIIPVLQMELVATYVVGNNTPWLELMWETPQDDDILFDVYVLYQDSQIQEFLSLNSTSLDLSYIPTGVELVLKFNTKQDGGISEANFKILVPSMLNFVLICQDYSNFLIVLCYL